MKGINIGDKVRITKLNSKHFDFIGYVRKYLVDTNEFLVEFLEDETDYSDRALFSRNELTVIESKEDIDRDIEKLYSALKALKEYCKDKCCVICPLRSNKFKMSITCSLLNGVSPDAFDINKIYKFEDKNENS